MSDVRVFFLKFGYQHLKIQITHNNFGYRDVLSEVVFGFFGFEFGFFEFGLRISSNILSLTDRELPAVASRRGSSSSGRPARVPKSNNAFGRPACFRGNEWMDRRRPVCRRREASAAAGVPGAAGGWHTSVQSRAGRAERRADRKGSKDPP